MSKTNRHTDHLTADDLQKYRAGSLSAAERHRVERLLLENPFYAEALDGLDAMDPPEIGLNRVSAELRERLQNRVQDRSARRLPLWIPAAVASVTLISSVGLYFWLPKNLETQEVSLSAPIATPSPSQTAPPADQTATRQLEPVFPKTEKPIPPRLARKVVPPRDSLVVPSNDLLATSDRPAKAKKIWFSPAPAASAPALSRTQAFRATESVPRTDIAGRVVDEQNLPLAGVSVLVKNSPYRTTTDSSGQFRLTEFQKTDTLQLVHLGYVKREIRAADLPTTSIQLQPDTHTLAEVVVTGQKGQRRMDITGAIPSKSSQLNEPLPPPNFQNYLNENRRMPPEAKEKGISGPVRLRFTVKKNGTIGRITVLQSLGYGCDEEAIRLIQEGPRWQPARRNNKPHAQVVEQEIVF